MLFRSKSEVEGVLASGRHVVLDIEIEGARLVRGAYPPPASVSVFILPPRAAVLIERLQRRRSETGAALAQRLERAVEELQEAPRYDCIVVNDDLATAVAEVEGILDPEAKRPARPANLNQLLDALGRELAQEAARLKREP